MNQTFAYNLEKLRASEKFPNQKFRLNHKGVQTA